MHCTYDSIRRGGGERSINEEWYFSTYATVKDSVSALTWNISKVGREIDKRGRKLDEFWVRDLINRNWGKDGTDLTRERLIFNS